MIIKSPPADVSIPNSTLPERVLASAAKGGDKPAMIDGSSGQSLTYSRPGRCHPLDRGRADGVGGGTRGAAQEDSALQASKAWAAASHGRGE